MSKVAYLQISFDPPEENIEAILNSLAEDIIIANDGGCDPDTESILLHVGPLAIGEVGANAMVHFFKLPLQVETYAFVDGFGMTRVRAIRRGVVSNENGWYAMYRFQL